MTTAARGADIIAVYRALTATGRIGEVLLAEYRCRQGCLLARAFQTPGRRLMFVPGYKLSPARNEAQTVPSARAKRTTDGDRRWRPAGYDLDELAAFAAGQARALVPVQCDHLSDTLDPADVLAVVAAVQPGRPVRRVVSRPGDAPTGAIV